MNSGKLIDVALDAIKTHGPNSEDFPSIGMFAKHHSTEIPSEYWSENLGTPTPSLDDVLSILEPVDTDEDDEEEDLEQVDETIIDFTLPGDATQYILCVSFDESGNIVNISMES